MTRAIRLFCCLALFLAAMPTSSLPIAGPAPAQTTASATVKSCFLLFELGVGELRRDPSDACATRITPASTFKVPHALAALDAGVVGPNELLRYDGTGQGFESWRQDHTLASALRHSVVWYFQQVAQRLGRERETAYLRRLAYGNMDASGGLTTFWLGGSLQVAPEEQQAFWVKLYTNRLPIAKSTIDSVKAMLVQPDGVVVNAAGAHPFDGPWAAGTIVSAKTGSGTDQSGSAVRWLVGHVNRADRMSLSVV